jgi:SAM-dependent methyltransferase
LGVLWGRKGQMFSLTARYYDKIYSQKDYGAEAQRFVTIVRERLGPGGHQLLDVACGTGRHIEYLKEHFAVEGLDISEELLEMARQRNPGVVFYVGDMTDFDLQRQYDVVACLFGSIGYVRTLANLSRAVSSMARHVRAGGLLIVEPWPTPETWRPGTVHALLTEEPELKIARMSTSCAQGRLSYFDLHYLIGTPEKTEHVVERHELGLFTEEEMEEALEGAGLEATYDEQGLTGRGLYVGRRVA